MEQFKEYIEIEYKKPFKNAGELLLQKATFAQTQQLKDKSYSYCYQTDFARISAQEISMIAEYATKHNATIRLGIDQNIYLFGLEVKPTALTPPRESAMIVACAGSEYCPYSYWNIKNETSYLPLEKINEHKIEVGFSGCTKGCARHQHADIGLIGLRTSSFGAAEGGAKLFLGAQHTEGKSVARAIFSMVPLQHLHALLSLIITLYEQSGYQDFEAYTAKVLNKYSEDFLALWFLLNLQTGQSIQLIAREENSFVYEKSLLGVHFLGLEVISFNAESFKKAVSLTSKKLWTI
jgi:ferredoxin-nitrite reductase